jgi:signal transduction histidine kinase
MLPKALIEASQLIRYLDEAALSRTDIHLPSVSVDLAGETRHLSLTLVPFESPAPGALIYIEDHPFESPAPGALIYIEDHTSAVEAERRARHKEHLAGIGTLSATIAHELRNPLAGISGALQVIVAEYSSDDRRKPILDKVLSEIRALNQMVTDLLTYARPREAQTENGVDLEALCRAICDGAKREFPGITFEICGETSASIDPDMFRHIVLNLVLNSCQATAGTGNVGIHIEPDVVTVSDDGPGLPVDVEKRMFEPFFTTKLKGTGLGLPISAKLARTMGGALRLAGNSPLGGACFELHLFKPSV